MMGAARPTPVASVRNYSPRLCTRTLLTVLTYLSSERLIIALRTWMQDAVALGYDITLIVCDPPDKESAFSAAHARLLRGRVTISNTFSMLQMNDSRNLERWKLHAFYRQILGPQEFAHSPHRDAMKGARHEPSGRRRLDAVAGHEATPGRHDWFVALDDDTLPEVSEIAHFLCAAVGGAEALDPTVPHYMGWPPVMSVGRAAGTARWFNDGKGFLLNRAGLRALYGQLLRRPRVRKVNDCTPSFTPFYWDRAVVDVPPSNMAYDRATECCPIYGVTQADVMLGVCLRWANVPITSIGSDRDGWWARMFAHGGPLKRATGLRAAYEFLRNATCRHSRCGFISPEAFRAAYFS